MTSLTHFSSFASVAVGIFSSQLLAKTPLLADRLNQLQPEVGPLREERQTLRSGIGLEGRAGSNIVKPAACEPTLSIIGLKQGPADSGDRGDARLASGNDRLSRHRGRINFPGPIFEDLDFRLEGDFAGTLLEASAYRAQRSDTNVNWSRYDRAHIEVGQFKTPFNS